MRVESLTLAVLLTVAAVLPAAAARRAPRPSAGALILKAFAAPGAPLRGRERVQFFPPGGKPRGMTALVTVLADGSSRREWPALKRVKHPLVLVRTAGRAELWWPKKGELISGPASAETPEAALARLKSFYSLAVSTGGHVAKRRTWRVDLLGRDGRLRRSLWVGRKTGLLLKTEDYRADGTLMRRRRYLKLEFPARADAADLRLQVPDGARRLSWSEPERGGAVTGARAPRWLPDGFLPVSVSRDGGAVVALYSDGAATVAVTEPRGRAATASGDLPDDELARVAASVPGAP
jgi:hypothetical protein